MTKILQSLLDNNRAWAERVKARNPNFFAGLSGLQTPEYLWIGCSDSRVPANQITGLSPGEVFVHRNLANVVVCSDLNCLSVLQYAVDVLKVKHIIVCGHYGCGGVVAAMEDAKMGILDNWLRHVQDVAIKHQSSELNVKRLCELNVIEQVVNVAKTTVVQDAWLRAQNLTIHGWIYGIQDGLIRDLGMSSRSKADLSESYTKAIAGVFLN